MWLVTKSHFSVSGAGNLFDTRLEPFFAWGIMSYIILLLY